MAHVLKPFRSTSRFPTRRTISASDPPEQPILLALAYCVKQRLPKTAVSNVSHQHVNRLPKLNGTGPFVDPTACASIECGKGLADWLATCVPNSVRHAVLPTSYFGLEGDVLGKLNREKEFAAGRFCTAQLLARWKDTRSVESAEDRSPIWPSGFCGSISHSRNWIWAAVARTNFIRSIGIDAEITVNAQTRAEIHDAIGTEDEWALMRSLGLDQDTEFTILFSAKESFYKCMYPIIQRYFDFSDVALESVQPGQLKILAVNKAIFDQQPFGLVIQYFVEANNVFTATWLSGN
jgi:enterobactin synthetase component D